MHDLLLLSQTDSLVVYDLAKPAVDPPISAAYMNLENL